MLMVGARYVFFACPRLMRWVYGDGASHLYHVPNDLLAAKDALQQSNITVVAMRERFNRGNERAFVTKEGGTGNVLVRP